MPSTRLRPGLILLFCLALAAFAGCRRGTPVPAAMPTATPAPDAEITPGPPPTPVIQPGGQTTGAVYVYDRRANGWRLRNVVKHNQPTTDPYERGGLGFSVSLGRAGKILAVGDVGDDVLVPHPGGLSGPRGRDSGAIWLY